MKEGKKTGYRVEIPNAESRYWKGDYFTIGRVLNPIAINLYCRNPYEVVRKDYSEFGIGYSNIIADPTVEEWGLVKRDDIELRSFCKSFLLVANLVLNYCTMFTVQDPVFFAMLIYFNVMTTITFVFYAWYFKNQSSSFRDVFFQKKFGDLMAIYAKLGDFPLIVLLPIILVYEIKTHHAILVVNIFASWITFINAMWYMKCGDECVFFSDSPSTPDKYMQLLIRFYAFTWYVIPAIMVNELFWIAGAVPFVFMCCFVGCLYWYVFHNEFD